MADDDLCEITGIGPARSRWLHEHLGVWSYDELAELDPQQLADQLREQHQVVAVDDIRAWQQEARRRATARKGRPGTPAWSDLTAAPTVVGVVVDDGGRLRPVAGGGVVACSAPSRLLVEVELDLDAHAADGSARGLVVELHAVRPRRRAALAVTRTRPRRPTARAQRHTADLPLQLRPGLHLLALLVRSVDVTSAPGWHELPALHVGASDGAAARPAGVR